MNIADDLFSHTSIYGSYLKKLCEPLEQLYGVTETGIFYITNKNMMVNIHTHEPWMEHCMAKEYYLDDPHIVDVGKMGTGFAVSTSSPSGEFVDGIIKDANELYSMYHGISYAKRTPFGYFAATFDTVKENTKMINRILRESSLVVEFTSYLEQELKGVINTLSGRAIDLNQLKKERLLTQEGIVSTKEQVRQKLSLLKKIGTVAQDFELGYGENLTPREVACLRCLVEGKNAIQSGEELCVSPRTAEWYFNKLKDAFLCKTKIELLKKAKVLHMLGLLS